MKPQVYEVRCYDEEETLIEGVVKVRCGPIESSKYPGKKFSIFSISDGIGRKEQREIAQRLTQLIRGPVLLIPNSVKYVKLTPVEWS